MTPDEEALQERIALVWEGAPSKQPITWADAERIATAQREQLIRLPFGKG